VKPLKQSLVLFYLFTALTVVFLSEYVVVVTAVVYLSFLFCFLDRLFHLASTRRLSSFLRHSGEWGFHLLFLLSLDGAPNYLFFLRTTVAVTMTLAMLVFASQLYLWR
jgi:hypothetical protein